MIGSAKQVAETFAPSQESYASVLEWLSEHGISAERVKQSQSLSWLHFDATVSEAENLLNSQYFEYKHATTGQAHVACEEYSIPEDIKKHIDFVTPTVHFDAKVEGPKKGRALNEREVAIMKRQTSTAKSQRAARSRTLCWISWLRISTQEWWQNFNDPERIRELRCLYRAGLSSCIVLFSP